MLDEEALANPVFLCASLYHNWGIGEEVHRNVFKLGFVWLHVSNQPETKINNIGLQFRK